MKVKRYDGAVMIREDGVEMVLICITDISEIGEEAFAGDFFEEVEKISFKESVDMVLLHVEPNHEDAAFITALTVDRIRTHARKYGKCGICVCIHRSNAREFRSENYWTRGFSIPYEKISLRKGLLADVLSLYMVP